MIKRDIAIVKAPLWDKDGKWKVAEDKLRQLGSQGYSVISVIPVQNADERGDVVWTLERTEGAAAAYR